MEPEALLAKIKALEEERDKLKEEVSTLKTSVVSSWTLRQRTSLSSIFNRPDGGTGLVGSTVGVAGWIKTTRAGNKGNLYFVKLNDGSHWEDIQVIVDKGTPGFADIDNGTACIAASIYVIGSVVSSLGKGQKIEVRAIEVRLLGSSDAAKYPLAKKAHSIEFLRELGHLRPRTTLMSAVTRVRNALAFGTHLFFQGLGYYYVNTPLITASDCEGAGEMFQVTTLLSGAEDKPSAIKLDKDGKIDYSADFFKKKSFLTVSGQLNGEIYACAMGSIYTFGPTFRAEESFTSRHLAEFWMIEPEIAFADLVENMNVSEQYIKFVLRYVMEKLPNEMEYLEKYEKTYFEERKKQLEEEEKEKAKKEDKKDGAEGKKKKKQVKEVRGFREQPLRDRVRHVMESDFARITYTEAIDFLLKSGVEFENKVEWGIDLASEHERWLAEEHFKRPTIVRNYPKEIKAFYMRLNEDDKTVAAMDVLVPGVGELIGGSQREDRLEVLEKRIKDAGLDPESYSFYLDLRRYGSVPHAGFGLGFERLVCYTTGMENIREAIPFPRWCGHAEY
eukprot:TRINITY_DN9641_c0_g1_i1.p1 TRINITY_DN9641_c0_g1~~TRINITY_DN9641_c0_g1_i1.p1  ORF type:complete len:559 (-),score=166.98 TRINITY_DN9641_c0_g1_i1:96-1772(-)